MDILLAQVTDKDVLELFSEYDDFMMEFLGKDRVLYARYSENERIEKVWIAYLDNIPIGCVAYRTKTTGIGELKRLFVKKEYRGRGVATELIKLIIYYAKKQGCFAVFLNTRIDLQPAVSLYRSSGFDIVFKQGLSVEMEKKIIV